MFSTIQVQGRARARELLLLVHARAPGRVAGVGPGRQCPLC